MKKQPNIKIEDMFKAVRSDVVKMTNGQQIPWESTSLNADFYFSTMTQDEINELVYQEIRNCYHVEFLYNSISNSMLYINSS